MKFFKKLKMITFIPDVINNFFLSFGHSKISFNFPILVLLGSVSKVQQDEAPDLWTKVLTFINIWPLHQWVFSLITLFMMYWLIGSWYNRRLVRQGGWLSWQSRIIMIGLDLLINFVLGIYYMGARDTLMGVIMFRCPIAISPLIFLIEFVVFVWYYKKYVLKPKKKN